MAFGPNFYDNLDEARRRLLRTVVLYDGKPCYIWDINENSDGIFRLFITMLPFSGATARPVAEDTPDEMPVPPPGTVIRKKINSKKFNNFRPIELGFINFFGQDNNGRDVVNATYSSRIPTRRGYQGLARETCSFITLNTGRSITLTEAITSDAFVEMVNDEYPPWNAVLDVLNFHQSIAVSKDFAISMEDFPLLYYKTDVVGLIMPDGTIYLKKDRCYLTDLIQECVNLPNNIRTI